MFDEMPEQFHHFITSSRPPPVPIPPPPLPPPPSFSLLHGGASGGASTVSFPPFEVVVPYNPNNNSLHHHHLHPQLQLLHQLHHHHHHKNGTDDDDDQDQDQEMNIKDHDDHENSIIDHHQNQIVVESSTTRDLWTNDEVLELLRIRSSMENWFPDFTWNHVSRKLAELGFKKSPEKCKDKFEEESRHLNHNNNNNVTYNNTKNYRFFSELEEICHGEQNQQVEVINNREKHDKNNVDPLENQQPKDDNNNTEKEVVDEETTTAFEFEEVSKEEKKRKRSSSTTTTKKKKFEMLKGFCEEIVNKMMSQQEDLNNKLIQDLIKRDKEKLDREESWMKQETERINKEINIRAQEHAVTKDRQSKIIEFLSKFNTNTNTITATSSSSTYPNQQTTRAVAVDVDNVETTTGKRWPRDEVLALINLRCNHYRDEKEGSGKGPLWERISKGMMELGYKRNAKRCKEKWENINKYFRKTKDVNKKRSVDSRTCPYFHQLSTLYNQGTTLGQPENRPTSPENRLDDDVDDDDIDDEGNEKNMGF